jgi:hypothetical protein
MSRLLTLLMIATAFFLTHPSLRAEDTPLSLPVGEPLATLALPDGFNSQKVSVAVSKALVADTWENLGWEGAITTATIKQSRINIKVFALASATDVKFFAEYTPEKSMAEEKCRQIALNKVRELEKTIATQLNLTFRKAKGDETIDRATAS